MTTDTRTPQERTYDWRMTVGRETIEMHLFEVGYWLGILGDYLDEAFMEEQQWSAAEFSWYHQAFFNQATDEGEGSRYEHTAEDLFVWAHDWMAGRTSPGNPA